MIIEDYKSMRGALEEMCRTLRTVPGMTETALFDSRLIATELLSNVLRHGGGRALFAFACEGGEVRITVRDENKFRPPETSEPATVTAESGRGLFLVDALSEKRDYTEECGIRVVLRIKE